MSKERKPRQDLIEGFGNLFRQAIACTKSPRRGILGQDSTPYNSG